MRNFVKKLMAPTHEQWLGHNMMKHHRTEGSIALKTKEELAREFDRLLDTDIHNIADKNRWMLDMDPADVAVMSIRETQYAIFELKAMKAQERHEFHSHRASTLSEHKAFGISNGTRLTKHARRSDNTLCRQKGDSNTATKPTTTKRPKKFSRRYEGK